jgi:hypothetical protein
VAERLAEAPERFRWHVREAILAYWKEVAAYQDAEEAAS